MKGLENHLIHYSIISVVMTFYLWFLSHPASPEYYFHRWFPTSKEKKVLKACHFFYAVILGLISWTASIPVKF